MAKRIFFSGKRPGFLIVVLLALAAGSESAWAQIAADLVVRKVRVEPTKANGDAWDAFNGKPDLKVTCFNGSKRHATKTVNNVLEADFNFKAFRVQPGTVVEIVVWDQDISVNDEIGRQTFTIGAAEINAGSVIWGGFDRVNYLVVEFRK